MKNKRDLSGWDKIPEDLGGEVEKTINELVGKEIKCCEEFPIRIDFFVGCGNPGGLEDKNGKRWWVVWICPKCGYQWNWGKLYNQLDLQKEKL